MGDAVEFFLCIYLAVYSIVGAGGIFTSIFFLFFKKESGQSAGCFILRRLLYQIHVPDRLQISLNLLYIPVFQSPAAPDHAPKVCV